MQPSLNSPAPRAPALRTIRLELDRSLRERSCVAEAVQGRLGPPAYLDLLTQLGWFLRAGARRRLTPESTLFEGDLRAVEGRYGLVAPRPSVVLEAFSDLVEGGGFSLDEQVTHAVCLALVGTPWTQEAAGQLAPRFDGATTLLGHLSREGERSLAAVEAAGCDAEEIEGFLGLAQGALLGAALHLDAAWHHCVTDSPSPCTQPRHRGTLAQ